MRSIRTRTLLGFLPRQRSLKQRFVFGISFSQFEHLSGLAGLVAGMLLEDQRALSEGPSPAALRYIAQVLQSLDGSPRLTLTKPPRPREERKRSLNEGKLILVGRGEVGKTSLVRRLSEVGKGRRGDVPRVHW